MNCSPGTRQPGSSSLVCPGQEGTTFPLPRSLIRHCCACLSPRACATVRRSPRTGRTPTSPNSILLVRGTLSRVNGHLVISEPKTERSRLNVPLSPAAVALLGGSRRAKWSSGSRRPRSGSRRASCSSRRAGRQSTPGTTAGDQRLAKALGVSGVGLHRLRHATRMLAAGVPLHTVSELLGHSCVAVTGGVYGHPPRRVCLRRPTALSSNGLVRTCAVATPLLHGSKEAASDFVRNGL